MNSSENHTAEDHTRKFGLLLVPLALIAPTAAQDLGRPGDPLSDLPAPHEYTVKRISSYNRSGGVEVREGLFLVDSGLHTESFNKIARANPWWLPFLLAPRGDAR